MMGEIDEALDAPAILSTTLFIIIIINIYFDLVFGAVDCILFCLYLSIQLVYTFSAYLF